MASFISGFTSSPPTVQVSDVKGSREDIVNIDAMYRILITNGLNTIKFSGYIPENFTIGLSSGWSAPFQGMSMYDVAQEAIGSSANAINVNGSIGNGLGGSISRIVGGLGGKTANSLMKFAGYGSYHKLLSAQVWDAPGYLTLELPIFLDGFSDTITDVVNPAVLALKMAAPGEKGGLLIPPGPSPAAEVANAIAGMASTGSSSESTDIFKLDESFTVTIGNFFSMSPAVIEAVSLSTENVMDGINGKPVSADIMISVKSYFAVTRSDLDNWFGVA